MTNARKDPPERQRGGKIEQWRGVGSFGTLGIEIVLCIALGFFGGKWLDEKFGTTPYLAAIGFCFGVAAAIKGVMRAHSEMQALAAKEEREQGNPRPLYDSHDDERDERDERKNDDGDAVKDSASNDDDSEDEEKKDR